VAEVNFVNTYTKETGEDVHHYPSLAVNKLDSDDRHSLEGASFALYKNYENGDFSEQVGEILTTNESGYLYFIGLEEGTYYLVETEAPEGYLVGYAIYRVKVEKKGEAKEQLINGKWCEVYEYTMSVEYSIDDGETWAASQHFAQGTTGTRYRLVAFNEKVSGQLTISKSFTGVDEDHYPASVTVTVTYPDSTHKDVILNAANNWTVTLSGLELGTYTLVENITQIPGYDFEGVTYNGTTSNSVTITEDNLIEDYDVNEPVAEIKVTIANTYERKNILAHEYPSLKIIKLRDSGNEPLKGAEFTLYSDPTYKNVVMKGTTDASGELTFQNIQGGVGNTFYYLKETSAPDGYVGSGKEYVVTVIPVSTNSKWVDYKYVTTTTYDVIVTDRNLNDKDFDAENNTLTVYNTKNEGSLTIKKSFGVNNAYMPDEVKAVVTGTGYYQEVTLSPANNWTVTLTGLALGEYIVTEDVTVTDVDGYPLYNADSVTEVVVMLSAEVENGVDQSIKIAELKNTYTKEVINPASFQIKKIDGETKAVITTSAEFTLYKDEACTKVAATEVTGIDGIATFAGFTEEATYYLKETDAPQYYAETDTVWKITVSLKNGEPTIKINETSNIWETVYEWITGSTESNWKDGVLTVENTKMRGNLVITKNVAGDENENRYTDAEYSFSVTLSDREEPVTFTLKAGERKVIENIPYGTNYTVVEDTIDAAFVSTIGNASGKVEAETTTVGATNTYTYKDNFPGLNLLKLDDETGVAIEGASFALYTDAECNTEPVVSGRTDKEGKLNLEVPYTAETTVYYLKETAPAEGYHAKNTVYTVTATPDYVVVDAGTENACIEKQLVITVDGLGEPAANGIYALYTVTNTAIKPVVIKVEKVWDDNNDRNRPDSVTVVLYCNDDPVEEVKLNAANEWRYIWEGEEYTDENTWTVDEVDVPKGYTKIVTRDGDDWTITNTKDARYVDVSVTKEWKGSDANRPDSILVTLYRNGEVYSVVKLGDGMGWSCTWEDLPAGYRWTVDEPDVPDGYTKRVYQSGYAFTIVNTYEGNNAGVKDDNPNTGDSNNLFGWSTMCVVGILGAAWMGYLFMDSRKKKN